MSERRRWQPVRGYESRIYEPREKVVMSVLDSPSRLWTGLLGHPARTAGPLSGQDPARVLVLRLDRIGDVVMSLAALASLRARLPKAHITLAVGSWSREVARCAPVDEVLEWNAPWVGRGPEGHQGWPALISQAIRLRRQGVELGIDLQGDPRAALLLWLSGARRRVGYVNAGGEWFLTHAVALDETVPWPEQNLMAMRQALGDVPSASSPALVTDEDIADAEESVGDAPRPWIGLHPSGGREIKQWPVDRWTKAAQLLVERFGGSVLVTGSLADRALAGPIVGGVGSTQARDLTGQLSLRQMLGVVAACDLFVSADTGPMHMAQVLGTPSVAVFGPSDPARYVSNQDISRHAIVQTPLWCSPCNLIRRPPEECQRRVPECLEGVSVEQVVGAGAALLQRACV